MRNELKTNRIALPDKRALAEAELKRRGDESEVAELPKEIGILKRVNFRQRWVVLILAVTALSTVALAIVEWLS